MGLGFFVGLGCLGFFFCLFWELWGSFCGGFCLFGWFGFYCFGGVVVFWGCFVEFALFFHIHKMKNLLTLRVFLGFAQQIFSAHHDVIPEVMQGFPTNPTLHVHCSCCSSA